MTRVLIEQLSAVTLIGLLYAAIAAIRRAVQRSRERATVELYNAMHRLVTALPLSDSDEPTPSGTVEARTPSPPNVRVLGLPHLPPPGHTEVRQAALPRQRQPGAESAHPG
ncbi:hypothetical protein D5S17_34155 [Pseudonocardiaceae bacterium YIM PH 21723]|nr:hypothetical protein D5S17_34155 [Pseudonocardiaceae bacterium YIM PH 21723]